MQRTPPPAVHLAGSHPSIISGIQDLSPARMCKYFTMWSDVEHQNNGSDERHKLLGLRRVKDNDGMGGIPGDGRWIGWMLDICMCWVTATLGHLKEWRNTVDQLVRQHRIWMWWMDDCISLLALWISLGASWEASCQWWWTTGFSRVYSLHAIDQPPEIDVSSGFMENQIISANKPVIMSNRADKLHAVIAWTKSRSAEDLTRQFVD